MASLATFYVERNLYIGQIQQQTRRIKEVGHVCGKINATNFIKL